jgi:hypothetical protein
MRGAVVRRLSTVDWTVNVQCAMFNVHESVDCGLSTVVQIIDSRRNKYSDGVTGEYFT